MSEILRSFFLIPNPARDFMSEIFRPYVWANEARTIVGRKIRKLTELELSLMQIIWANAEEISVGKIRERLTEQGHPLALPSIRTMLAILQEKGFINRRLSGKAYLYKAIIPASAYQQSFLKSLLERTFDGSASGLVSALLSKDVVDDKELDKIKQLIRDFDEDQKS